jgi:uncharacterized membrane protein (UPF0127 family)
MVMAIALLGSGCEPRIEEPLPPPKIASKPATARASSAHETSPAPACLRPTPAVATRQITTPVPDPRCPKDPLDAPPKLRMGKVTFEGAPSFTAEVEIAETEETRERGLMFRRSMAEDHGMIFAFDRPRHNQFWMHNTCIPLDMLFIAEDGTIVGIEENVPTMDDSTFEVGCPSSFVLELNAGTTRKHGIAAGQKVHLDGVR